MFYPMKKIILKIILCCCINNSFAQKTESIYLNPKDSTSNYFITFKPQKEIKGLLVLMTSFGETPEIAMKETDIHLQALERGIFTAFVTLQDGRFSFDVDSISQHHLDMMIIAIQSKYNIEKLPFYIGGFSLGGSGVVKYTERSFVRNDIPKPKAIFAIDPPLDFERFYTSIEKEARTSTSEIGKNEAKYFLQRIQEEVGSKPKDNIKAYHQFSPYSYSDTNNTTISYLKNCPILLITEPDILWQMKERDRNIYDINAIDCSAAINTLRLLGNKNAELTLTQNKGFRKYSGKRNPHSWSIGDGKMIVDWLLKF
jgi:hypothetical protein